MRVQAGQLNRRVSVQQKVVTRDAFGGEAITWQTVADVWAAQMPVRGREYVALRAAGAEITTRFVIRYRSGITPAMRVVDEAGAQYNVVEVINPDDARQFLELMASAEVVPT